MNIKFEKGGTQYELSNITRGNHSYHMNIRINETLAEGTVFLRDNTLVFSLPEEAPIGKRRKIDITLGVRRAIKAEAITPTP